MSSTTTSTAPVTMRSFLFDTGTGADTAEAISHALNEHGVAGSALQGVRHLSASATKTVDREIGTVVDGLLEMDLGDILVSGWRKHRSLTDAARRTLATPGSEEVVALAAHRVTATYRPHVDLLVDSAKVNTFEFELTTLFDLTGVAAVVSRGDLVAVQGGACTVTATLTLEGAQLAQRQGHLDPALIVRLQPGMPLIDKAATTQPLPQQRTSEETAGPAPA